MFTIDARLTALSSPELLAAMERLAAQARELTADLVALLVECDQRKLYAEEGYASLFEFCVQRLRLSEAQAYHRIQAARVARRFPLALERLREGRVSLTAVALLREHLTEANHRDVLEWAEGRGKREVEVFIRTLDPRTDVPSSLRRLPGPRAVVANGVAAERTAASPAEGRSGLPAEGHHAGLLLGTEPSPRDQQVGSLLTEVASRGLTVAGPGIAPAPAAPREAAVTRSSAPPPEAASDRRPEIRPLAPARYSLHVMLSQETHDKLRRAQDLLRHADAAVVLDRALTLLVAQLERKKAGAPRTPRKRETPSGEPEAKAAEPVSERLDNPGGAGRAVRARGAVARSRYIPATVRRAVWDRDGGRCTFVSRGGRRCSATASLEYHHRVPFADGGATTVDNLALACRLHNAREAERWFNSVQAEFEAKRHQKTFARGAPEDDGV